MTEPTTTTAQATQATPTGFDDVDDIMRFEDGAMSEAEVRVFLTRLRDNGLLFKLQGFYGRTARALGII